MSAHWPVTGDEGGACGAVPLPRLRLGLLLDATARRYPDRLALIDPADKLAWSGRPPIAWTYAAAAEIVARLAGGLRGWRLAPKSRIGLCLPGSAESALALLAVEAAGHLPCLLPVSWDEDRLATAAAASGLSAVLTQSRLGRTALAERICAVAARYFGLRYVAAFGPDVPDGVINLDRMVLEGTAAAPAAAPASRRPRHLRGRRSGAARPPCRRRARDRRGRPSHRGVREPVRARPEPRRLLRSAWPRHRAGRRARRRG